MEGLLSTGLPRLVSVCSKECRKWDGYWLVLPHKTFSENPIIHISMLRITLGLELAVAYAFVLALEVAFRSSLL